MPEAAQRQSRLSAGRPRVGFLAAYLTDEYEWAVWQGVRAAVEERGGTAVCFAGAGFGDPSPERQARSALFELTAPACVDALLCLSSVVSHYGGIAKTEAWLSTRGLPCVSIGPAEKIPSVAVDDSSGIHQLMQHLMDHHEHRRIAFIAGSESNAESARRLRAYEQALAGYGVALDPKLVLHGDFTLESGNRAIAELFDRRQVRLEGLDAVVAANDYMAFGAIDELGRRRVKVPEQVAVVGFDDIQPARFHLPSLTTVRQPLERLGREGAERLLDLLEGRPAEGSRTLETELVLRRSCGCIPTDVPPAPEGGSELEEPTLPGRKELASNLEVALMAELHGAAGAFTRALEPHLRQAASGSSHRLDQGRRFADELATRVRAAREDLVHQRLGKLAHVLHTRMFGPQALLSTTLAELLPDFGVDACAVSEVVNASTPWPNAELKLAFGYDEHTIQPQMTTFEAPRLVPPSFQSLQNRSVIALPLVCGAERLGIAVLPATGRDGPFYETLGWMFGTILKVLDLRRRSDRAR